LRNTKQASIILGVRNGQAEVRRQEAEVKNEKAEVRKQKLESRSNLGDLLGQ
jgi:hypothetical protein